MTWRQPSSPSEEGRRDGALSLPGRWRLAVAASVVAIVMLVAAGAVGASRYVSGFWLYRGFAPPAAPHSVTIRSAAGTRHVPVALPSLQSITVRSPALGGYLDPVYVLLPPGYASHPRQRYPVLYLLHGFPGLVAGFLNIGQVATTEATLAAGTSGRSCSWPSPRRYGCIRAKKAAVLFRISFSIRSRATSSSSSSTRARSTGDRDFSAGSWLEHEDEHVAHGEAHRDLVTRGEPGREREAARPVSSS